MAGYVKIITKVTCLKAEIDEYIREGEEKADQLGEKLKSRFGQTAI